MEIFRLINEVTPGKKVIVVGDIHGQVKHLERLLEVCNYVEGEDNLLLLGDLIDRGPGSLTCLRFLNKSNVYSCFGNHEWMALSTLKHQDTYIRSHWYGNGGGWAISNSAGENQEVIKLIERGMTYGIGFNWKQMKIGLVHADFPADCSWKQFMFEPESFSTTDLHEMIWSRKRASMKPGSAIDGVDLLFVGHSVVEKVTRKSNVVLLDTGAALIGKGKKTQPALSAAVFGESLQFISLREDFSIGRSTLTTI